MIKYPDYENCIVNLAASVLQEFGADTGETKGLAACKELFAKQYKNIVVLLLDGMGISVMEKNLKRSGFFRSHLLHTYSSVFPWTPVNILQSTPGLAGIVTIRQWMRMLRCF